jgi:alpha-L-arabinofuranosidase
MDRRHFLKTSVMAGSLAAFGARAFAATDSRIEVLLDEPLGIISPFLYGHFTENLGAVVYDGIWVGEKSRIPNTHGIRSALVERMRALKAPVVRWPGGCFADSYDWRDGVGPMEQRPRRTNFWIDDPGMTQVTRAAEKYDPNQFGSAEFFRFCQLSGAQPYFAANVRSLPPEQFDRWVEFCNSPAGSTSLADLRAAEGFRDPFPVLIWGVGNEAWGCGGNFTPREYASEFRRFTAWVPHYGLKLSFVASGPNGDEGIDWTHGFFQAMAEKGPGEFSGIFGWALHHYAWNLSRGRTRDWVEGKGDALNFEPVDWYELLREGDRMEGLITSHWEAMGEVDREHKVKLVVDEWGPWYRPGSELNLNHLLGQQITMRDAVFSGMTLDTFNRHPDKVAMACDAQLLNNLNCLFFAHEDQFIVTPNYHVFEMYAAHQGGESVRAEFLAPVVHYEGDGKPASFWSLKGSASWHADANELVVSVVNADVTVPHEAEVVVRGGRVVSGAATTLVNRDIHAHNTFEQPEAVRPQSGAVPASDGTVAYRFPPASVTVLRLKLA